MKCNREREGHILSSTDLGLFSFLCAALASRARALSLSSLPTFRSFLPFPRGFHPSLLADVATCDARSRIRHVSHITLFLLGDGRTRTEEEGLGAAGEVAAAEPAMIPDGEKLDANRHATNGGSRRGTAWSSNGAGGIADAYARDSWDSWRG